jgi:hypothetical protein
MMSIYGLTSANLTGLFLQITSLNRSLDGKVGIVLGWIGSTPVGLTGIGLQH